MIEFVNFARDHGLILNNVIEDQSMIPSEINELHHAAFLILFCRFDQAILRCCTHF